jgi:hypothetical protein
MKVGWRQGRVLESKEDKEIGSGILKYAVEESR